MIQFYPVCDGKFYAGEYPGGKNPENAVAKLKFLLDMGIRTFVDLTDPTDKLEPYWPLLAPEISYHNFRILDGKVPQFRPQTRYNLDTINLAMEANRPVYIHCWGGVGRTGTIVGCWLAENGWGRNAPHQVQKLYSEGMAKASRMPNSPETPEQKDYIIDWGWDLPTKPIPTNP